MSLNGRFWVTPEASSGSCIGKGLREEFRTEVVYRPNYQRTVTVTMEFMTATQALSVTTVLIPIASRISWSLAMATVRYSFSS